MTKTFRAEEKVAKSLSILLSNYSVLYVKTQNFHWNLLGSGFFFLHKMFEEQYEDLAEAIDLVAERIRGLKFKAPGTMKEFLKMASLEEAPTHSTCKQMIQYLLNDHECIIDDLHQYIKEATDLGDEGSADLFIERVRVHEKTAWILRSHIDEKSSRDLI